MEGGLKVLMTHILIYVSHLSGSTSKIEVLCVFGDNADRGCREYEFINQFCDCFVDNINNIGHWLHCNSNARTMVWNLDLWSFCMVF